MNKERERLAQLEEETLRIVPTGTPVLGHTSDASNASDASDATVISQQIPDPTIPIYTLGKNAQDNWKIYKQASQSHTVFHLESLTSPYVIVNRTMDELTPEMIQTASVLCKSKSKHKNLYNLKVMYTSISNTKLGDAVGSFIVISNHKKKTIII